MVKAPLTVRSERTREALRQAALVRFLAQGVEGTTAEEIAADAGVSLRTFYRHFTSKHELLFADYDAGLHWFRSALVGRPVDEPLLVSVQAAIFAFPYDFGAVTKIAALREQELDQERIVGHVRQVEGDFADAIAEHLGARSPSADRLTVAVTSRTVAAAVFGAMEVWMLGADRSLPSLARMCHAALDQLAAGLGPAEAI
ncbi:MULTISPECIES: TetR/AcrR family transcriptional regulator [unclassified Mycolicibacterium]|uniref:TetR/AcrR family transcriptional regulator n=1 Tax=unclassified Mycolicibacterium TaxID=2636767 RepID=UPI0012DF06E1|nr:MULTISPECIES: TetR/AcrR family transcriptional regulator [unclassified Mycolicibacterium]MUL61931.1 TetR family transcriptional regulator [Mycolicibacterium sp. CBMA 335]MUM08779.1 TetR family transcriptional regulator [Mycolicibacterium sp. CBMA 213]